MATYTDETRRYVELTRGQANEREELLKQLVQIAKLKGDYLDSRNDAAVKEYAEQMRARNDLVEARARIAQSVNAGAYAADVNSAQRDADSLRDAYVRLSNGYSAQSNALVQRVQSEAAMRGSSPDEQKSYAWMAVIDRLDVANPALPTTIRAAERVLGDPESGATAIPQSYLIKLAELRRAANDIDGQANKALEALNDPERLGRQLSGADGAAITEDILRLVPNAPATPDALDYQLTEEDVADDLVWKRLDELEAKYDTRLDELDGRPADGGPQAAGIAELLARPAFQEWAADHGFVIGTGAKGEDGTWSYLPGKDDAKAIRFAKRQMEGRFTPDRSRHATNPRELIAIDVLKPGNTEPLRDESGHYRAAMLDGKLIYAPPDIDLDSLPDLPGDTSAAPMFAAVKNGAVIYTRDPDGTLHRTDAVTRATETVADDAEIARAELGGAEFTPLFRPDGKAATRPEILSAALDPDGPDLTDVSPNPEPGKMYRTTTRQAPPSEAFRVYGQRVARNPRDPADSIRVETFGGERVFRQDGDSWREVEDAWATTRPPPKRAFDYEAAVISADQPDPNARQRVERLRGAEAARAARLASPVSPTAKEAGPPPLGPKGNVPTPTAPVPNVPPASSVGATPAPDKPTVADLGTTDIEAAPPAAETPPGSDRAKEEHRRAVLARLARAKLPADTQASLATLDAAMEP